MYPAEFANVYDALMDDVDYPRWAQYYAQLAGLSAGQTVCECGCGTGSMTVELCALGLNMTGVDLSEGMLRVASDKARKRALSIPFIRQDMCELVLHRGVDAVLAPCDGVNYMLDGASVHAFFRSAHRALKGGGTLAFDVSTPSKLQSLAGATFFEDREGVSYFWTNQGDGALTRMSLTFFVRQGGGLYKRFDEAQTQRAHALDDLMRALQASGFERIRAFGDQTLTPACADDLRWHIAANKPMNTGAQ